MCMIAVQSVVCTSTLRVKSVMFCTVIGRMTFWPIITSLNLTNGRPPSEMIASDGFTDGQWMSSHRVFAGLHAHEACEYITLQYSTVQQHSTVLEGQLSGFLGEAAGHEALDAEALEVAREAAQKARARREVLVRAA